MGEVVVSTFVEVLVPIIATAVGTVLIALARNISIYLSKKTQSDLIDKYIKLLESTVIDVVQGLNQTTVSKLKEASSDGKLTPEEIESINEDAAMTIKNILGVEGMEILNTAFSDFDKLVASKIERAVLETKPTSCTAVIEEV